MMNSRWARFMGVAVGAIAVGLVLRAEAASSEDQRLHVAAAPADYAALGIGQKIAIWEDGRRTPKSADTFEWWYFDGLLDDGTVVVVWFGDNWFFGSHNRAVTMELTPPGKPTRRVMRTFEEPGSFSNESYLVIGFAAGIPSVPLNLTLLKGCSIVGVFWGPWVDRCPDAHRRNTQELISLFQRDLIRPWVSGHFPLNRGGEAIRQLADRQGEWKARGPDMTWRLLDWACYMPPFVPPTVSFDAPLLPVRVLGNADAIADAVRNLGENAVHQSLAGGGALFALRIPLA
jgi:hypothetical protein